MKLLIKTKKSEANAIGLFKKSIIL